MRMPLVFLIPSIKLSLVSGSSRRRIQPSMGTTPDLFELLNKSEMRAVIQRSGTRLIGFFPRYISLCRHSQCSNVLECIAWEKTKKKKQLLNKKKKNAAANKANPPVHAHMSPALPLALGLRIHALFKSVSVFTRPTSPIIRGDNSPLELQTVSHTSFCTVSEHMKP